MESSRDRRSRHAAFVLSAGALAGVLIWAKLRLVENIPRSAYAEPDRAVNEPDSELPPAGAERERGGVGGASSENGD